MLHPDRRVPISRIHAFNQRMIRTYSGRIGRASDYRDILRSLMSNQTLGMMMSLMPRGNRCRVRSRAGTRRLMLGRILICEIQGIAAFYETMPETWYIKILSRKLSTALVRHRKVSRGPKEAYWNSSTLTKALRKQLPPAKTSIALQIQMIWLSSSLLLREYLNA